MGPVTKGLICQLLIPEDTPKDERIIKELSDDLITSILPGDSSEDDDDDIISPSLQEQQKLQQARTLNLKKKSPNEQSEKASRSPDSKDSRTITSAGESPEKINNDGKNGVRGRRVIIGRMV